MLTGELRSQVDGIWSDFWSGGLANPLQVIEQITYLIFIKRLDEIQEVEERKAATLGTPLERRIFPEGKDERGEPCENLRWSRPGGRALAGEFFTNERVSGALCPSNGSRRQRAIAVTLW